MTQSSDADRDDLHALPDQSGIELDAGTVADLAKLVERVERHLVGGERVYTRLDIAEKSGMSLDHARALWRALGFATVDDDSRVFTDADLAALDNVKQLESVAEIDDDVMNAMTRMIGQSFARLASWQGQLVLEIVATSPELASDPDRMLELVDRMTPLTAQLHDYVWRRQLAAYFARVASNVDASGGASRQAVGFVDMADFTAFTRRSSENELRDVLTRFETVTTDVVGGHRGQIVKSIGDEILYVADSPADAAEIALCLVEAAEQDDVLPLMRAGVAYGPVVSRLGDVYGSTVNIASRLTSLARTDSVLIDDGLADALKARADFALRPLRSVSVRGYHHLHSWRLRRADRTPSR